MTDPRIATLRAALDTLTDASFGEADDAAMHEDSLNAYAALVSLADGLAELRREERRWYEQFHTEMQRADAAEALAAVVALRDAARNLRCCAECEGDLGRWEKFDDALALFPAGTDSTEEQP